MARVYCAIADDDRRWGTLHCPPMERHSALVAVVLNAVLLIALAVTVVIDRDLADRLTREDAAVEWLQAGLFVLAAVLALRTACDRWRAGASPVAEVLVAAM